MKNNAIKWLYAVPEKKKLYILALMFVQALNGGSGVLYALLLRNIVDNATAHDKAGFWHYVLLTVLLVLGQIAIRAVIMMIVLDWRFACVLLPCGVLLLLFTYGPRQVYRFCGISLPTRRFQVSGA